MENNGIDAIVEKIRRFIATYMQLHYEKLLTY